MQRDLLGNVIVPKKEVRQIICDRCKEEIGKEKVISREDIQKVIRGWKIVSGIQSDDKDWDKVFYPRYTRTAKHLLLLFRNVGEALDCIEYVFNDCKKNRLSCSFETVVKRADTLRYQLDKKESYEKA